jgi:tetratricopeptide (TPR) repeat protein
MNKNMKKILAVILLAGIGLGSCKKWLDQPPIGALRSDLFNTANDAQETLNSCYDALANLYDGRIQSISELLSDNLQQPNTNNDLRSVYARQTTFFNSTSNKVYQDLYTVIWRCNTLLDNIEEISDLSETEKNRMMAEARFLRGFCHWSAVKLWAQPYGYTAGNVHAGVPIRRAANADPLLRSTVQEVYDFVIGDLKYAHDNLQELNSVYATKYAAAGVLANVYFLMNDYSSALVYCNEVINSGQFALLSDHHRFPEISYDQNSISESVFGTVSKLYLLDSDTAQDRRCGSFVSYYRKNNGVAELMLSENFLQFINLNPADQRIDDWIETENNRGFLKKVSDANLFSVPIIHLTELKLIRAEALGELGSDLSTAIQDLNDIRLRAYGPGSELPEAPQRKKLSMLPAWNIELKPLVKVNM